MAWLPLEDWLLTKKLMIINLLEFFSSDSIVCLKQHMQLLFA
jgi:hypothetical protein